MRNFTFKTLCLAIVSLLTLSLYGQAHLDRAPGSRPQLAGALVTDGTCAIDITGYDAYGDGWNGATIDMQVNGVSIATFTVSTGTSETGSFTFNSGDLIDFVWTEGSFDDECSFTISGPLGNAVYTSSGIPVAGSFFTYALNCSTDFPNPPTNLVATPDPNQGLSATLTWTNPTTTYAGNPVTLTSVVVKRGSTIVHTIANPVAGANESFVDVVPAAGVYRYSVYATNTSGTSDELTALAAIGGEVVMQFGQTMSITTCSMSIFDNGGYDGNYANNSNDVLIIYPATSGSSVAINGTFVIESSFDYLYVYDGAGTSGALLSTYTNSDGGTISNVSLSGPLTLHFTSDGSVQKSGFEISASCVAPSSVAGTVTALATGAPIAGAVVSFVSTTSSAVVTDTTDASGAYSRNVLSGSYAISVKANGYNVLNEAGYVVPATPVTGKNFALTAPSLSVTPTDVTITSLPNGTGTGTFTITNNGDGPLNWSAQSEIDGIEVGDAWELLGSFKASAAGMQAVATDGNYIYLTSWQASPTAGHTFEKYSLDFQFIEGFDIPNVSGIRDLTYDGQYFYGGAAGSTLYCLDLDNQTLIGTTTTTVSAIRHCSYDPVNDGFWVGNWTDLYLINRSGAVVQTSPVTLNSAYGSGYDNVTPGGPYLLFFAQPNTNAIVQRYTIATGALDANTLFDFAVTPDFIAGTSIAGGAYAGPYNGRPCFFGNVQQDPNLIGIYSLTSYGWMSTSPSSGVLEPGASVTVTITADAGYGGGLPNGSYTGTVHINTNNPDVGSEDVDVTFIVGDCDQPQNIAVTTNEIDQEITFQWDAVVAADSYAVFVNGVMLDTVFSTTYVLTGAEANTEYCFTVATNCTSGSSAPSAPACVTFMPTGSSINTSTYAIYPNPANDQVIVEGNDIRSISVVNLLGQTMEHVNLGDGAMHVINTSAYNSGVYIFRIVRGDGMVDARSIIVAH